MQLGKKLFASAIGAAVALSFGFASAASALTATCTGTPTATNITWTANVSGAINPVALLWGNGATTSPIVVPEPFGTYQMTLQATDASSSVATTTCSATVAQPVPSIASFTATPSTINAGQSTVLAWSVTNASSTSIDNGVGAISSTSITVSPTVTTTYTLTATNPGGSSTAVATVTVGTSTGSTGGSNLDAITALLQQIAALKSQLAQLILQQLNGGAGTTTTATSTPTCNFMRDLKRGDSGDDVKELQLSLAHSDPSIFPSGLITGFFGGKTEAALKILQKRFGISLAGTGYFGPKSREFFKMNCGKHEDADNNENDNHDGQHASSTMSFEHGSTTMMGEDHGENGNGNDHGNGNSGGHGNSEGHGNSGHDN